MASREIPEKFLVAFSFAGEQRDLVRSIAEAIEAKLGRSNVFFDEWFEHYIAGDNADLKLQKIYHKQCELAVVCVSERYGDKPWTQAEHEAIRARKMELSKCNSEKEKLRILPIRVGEGDIDGILFNAIVPDVRKKTISESADLVIDRLRLIVSDFDTKTEASSSPHMSWPIEPTTFEHDLADRTDEWPAVLRLLSADTSKRILMFEGKSGFSKSALLRVAKRYADSLKAAIAYIDFKDTNLLSESDFIKEIQLGLKKRLPEFAATKESSVLSLRDSLRQIDFPILIILDTYEKVTETKEFVERIETKLLAEVEECKLLRFLIAGQKVPDSANTRWKSQAEKIELEKISDVSIWKTWIQTKNPNLKDEHVEGVVLGLGGVPANVSMALESLAENFGKQK